MFLKAIKNKLLMGVTLLLVFLMAFQPLTVYAGGANTNAAEGVYASRVTTTIGVTTPRLPPRCRQTALAIFLYGGDYVIRNPELMNRERLTTDRNQHYEPINWFPWEGDGDAERLSILSAYSARFRRNQIAWTSATVLPSLIITGPAAHWGGFSGLPDASNLMLSDQSRVTTLAQHRVQYGTNSRSHWGCTCGGACGSAQNSSRHIPSSVTPGYGMHMPQIIEYLNAWFAGETSEYPYAFIRRIFNEGRANATAALNLWQFIAEGTVLHARGLGDANNSPNARWTHIFTLPEDQQIGWGNTYITPDGLRTADGDFPDWESGLQQRQIASYLDSLITLALMVHADSSRSASSLDAGKVNRYLDAAIDFFGGEGEAVRNVSDLEVTRVIVLQTVTMFRFQDSPIPTVTEWYTWWGAYRSVGGPVDFRRHEFADFSRPGNRHYLENSHNFARWSGGGSMFAMGNYEFSNFCGLRLFAADTRTPTTNTARNSRWTLGTSGGNLVNPMRITGSTQAHLAGLRAPVAWYYPNTQTSPGVGGQFVISVFAHASSPPSGEITHSIHAEPIYRAQTNPYHRIPDSGTLDRRPHVEYRIGNTFDGDRATTDNGPAERMLESMEAVVARGGRIETRTVFASQVVEYRLNGLAVPSDTGIDFPNFSGTVSCLLQGYSPIPGPRTPIVGVPTALGSLTAPELGINQAQWQPTTLHQLEQLLLGTGSQQNIMINYLDDRFEGYLWPVVPPTVNGVQGIYLWTWYRGADYWLRVRYFADTQIRVIEPDCMYVRFTNASK